ncbi:hypothetical protein AXX16_0056 [Serratia rubidaea]|nr:hypothetical protein AXX16_0056 [Serratia rubidaea]
MSFIHHLIALNFDVFLGAYHQYSYIKRTNHITFDYNLFYR